MVSKSLLGLSVPLADFGVSGWTEEHLQHELHNVIEGY